MKRRNMARAVLVDQNDSILMFKFKLIHSKRPATWITPGGGIEYGETPAETIARELWEETGLKVERVLSPIYQDEVKFLKTAGYARDSISQRTFYGFRVNRFHTSKSNWTPIELESTLDERWWNIEELTSTTENLQVSFLPNLITGISSGELPSVKLDNSERLI